MTRRVPIGKQNFAALRENNYFYVDKTFFIKEWWESGDDTTVILRPRRFGKTLTMSMMEHFFSVKYAGRADLFEGLAIWEYEEFRAMQGTYPVINISLASIKETTYEEALIKFRSIISDVYRQNAYLKDSDKLTDMDKEQFEEACRMFNNKIEITESLKKLSELLYKHHNKKVLIFLDEYDTPMQEAFLAGYWNEIVGVIKNLFNATFKTNPYLERALMTGITRVSKESIFSDFNHVNLVSTLSDEYTNAIGFTEEEVFAALDEYGIEDKAKVKYWYDGFTFGDRTDMYNPWSITRLLRYKKYECHWANTSRNGLIALVLRQGSLKMKQAMEDLLNSGSVRTKVDEQLFYASLIGRGSDISAYSLMLSAGYLTVDKVVDIERSLYELRITNHETREMFRNMIIYWFTEDAPSMYNEFVESLLKGQLREMNYYMRDVVTNVFSFFDVGINAAENFYHAFTLGLMVDLRDKYIITSNRESGLGRYDIMLEPRDITANDGIIIEFKVLDEYDEERDLKDTVTSALKQIEEKQYEAVLVEKGVPAEKIRKYGFAFKGKEVLIAEA